MLSVCLILGGAAFAPMAHAQLGGPPVQYWHENVPNVQDVAVQNEHFGHVSASGDFDGDGVDDLAIGVPSAQVGTIVGAGAVHVLYGRAGTALYPLGQYWYQNLIAGATNESGDWFGSTLASGDFDGDGFDDLAIGSPGETHGDDGSAGQVQVIYGSVNGLSNARGQIWHQDRPGVNGETESVDQFGGALAAGDFDADGVDDLAVGVPGEGLGGVFFEYYGAGAVQVFYGQFGSGLGTARANWIEEGGMVFGYVGDNDNFGDTLAVGDFNNDGVDDLAIGAPGERNGSGEVSIVMGWFGLGLTAHGSQVWSQNSAGVADSVEDYDAFGYALAVGDWNADGFDDLAIGAPFERLGTLGSAGIVHTLVGTINGLTATGSQSFTQDTGSILDFVEAGDQFGRALAAGDFNRDGRDDLAIGVMGESLPNTQYGAGIVQILNGASTGLTTNGNRMWSQDSRNVGGVATEQRYFGYSLAVGDFDDDGVDDLVIGTPYDDPGIVDAGSVNVLLALDGSGDVIGFGP
jgi:hypothetical protein